GGGVFAAHPQALLAARGMLLVPQGPLDQVELADEIQRDAGVAVGGVLARFARLVEPSPSMSEAPGVHWSQGVGDSLVRLIAVGEQHAVIALQQPQWHCATA